MLRPEVKRLTAMERVRNCRVCNPEWDIYTHTFLLARLRGRAGMARSWKTAVSCVLWQDKALELINSCHRIKPIHPPTWRMKSYARPHL